MPYLEINVSGSVKERQTDTDPAAEFSLEVKSSTITEYDGAKRITIGAGKTVSIDTSFLVATAKFLSIILLSGDSINLQLRRENSTANDILIGQFFCAEVRNLEQIKLYNAGSEDVVARIFMVGGTP